jgi:DNA-binding HxlR family transcriptional regulator
VAERPRTLGELERLIQVFGYRKLERIVRDLIKAGLVERVANDGRQNPCGATEWARGAASVLAAAMRWERHEIPKRSASVTSVEAEGVLLLGLPLIEVPEETSGTCALLVDADAPREESLGGAIVQLTEGRPVAWRAVEGLEVESIELEVDCCVRGPTLAWLGTHTKAPRAYFRIGGEADLAENVMAALRAVGSLRPSLPAGGRTRSGGIS